MNSKGKMVASDDDLIDRIAKALPVEVRADYYRELNHCRSLPENDEMLRILRAMQFLTLLMDQVPQRVVEQREQVERLRRFRSERNQALVDERLTDVRRAAGSGENLMPHFIEAVDGGIGGGSSGDSFAFTVFFDHKEAPVNYRIFGPKFTFTGRMVEGEITIIDPRHL